MIAQFRANVTVEAVYLRAGTTKEELEEFFGAHGQHDYGAEYGIAEHGDKRILQVQLPFNEGERVFIGYQGDYIVVTTEGKFVPLPAYAFEAIYSEVTEND